VHAIHSKFLELLDPKNLVPISVYILKKKVINLYQKFLNVLAEFYVAIAAI
jgi:hypothetical protein